ncbi:MAG: class I SAM-dependent methyltransferase [Burkholderiales bacterium]
MGHKVSSRELGLILGARLLKTEDLHYGYWTDGLKVSFANLPAAQAAYCDYLLGKIPADVKTVLDVGCGTGHVAQLLLQRGYGVECVSPAPLLTEAARKRLGPDVTIYPTTLEALSTPNTYDLLLFSESFQYISPRESLPRANRLLRAGGYVLLSDFFSVEGSGPSALGGGHPLKAFYATLARQPFRVLLDEDITARTAPNLKLIDDMLQDYVMPVWDALGYYFRSNRPWLTRLARPFLRRRLKKLEFKYFSRQRTAEEFVKHKSYHCMLLQKTGETGSAAE